VPADSQSGDPSSLPVQPHDGTQPSSVQHSALGEDAYPPEESSSLADANFEHESLVSEDALSATSDHDNLAPGVDHEDEHSQPASSGLIKTMKTTAKHIQFYTTIVCLVCVNVREFGGFSGTTARAAKIFKLLESGLRDRQMYPLPEDVSLKDLMGMSFFKGFNAEAEFNHYCKACQSPLTAAMIQFADNLYIHKFTDIKKNIRNVIIPSYLAIVKQVNGNGKKSG
jgi:hypothetical protein